MSHRERRPSTGGARLPTWNTSSVPTPRRRRSPRITPGFLSTDLVRVEVGGIRPVLGCVRAWRLVPKRQVLPIAIGWRAAMPPRVIATSHDEILVLEIDNPPVNALSPGVPEA